MIKRLGLFLIFVVLLTGCRELVTNDFTKYKRTPVINSLIRAGERIVVHASYTGSLGDTVINNIGDANISLYVNDTFAEKLHYISDGYYYSDIVAVAGNKYACEIEIIGEELIFCRDSIPLSVGITGISHNSSAGVDEEGKLYPAVSFTFPNNRSEKQYFQVVLRLFDYEEREAELIDITDPLIKGGGMPLAVFSNEGITGDSYNMTLNYVGGSANQERWTLYPFVIEFRSLSYDYYQYLRKRYLYELSRYPDDLLSVVPGFNLHSNITGGLGIFAGYSVFVSDTIRPEI